MKTLIWIIICLPFFCVGQNVSSVIGVDSASLSSRMKADSVLAGFEDINGTKLLYSIQDNKFYVCIKSGNNYHEFFITVGGSKCFKITKLKTDRKIKRLLSEAFILKKYRQDFITAIENAKFIQGYPSYFVVKDEGGKRYGEFALSSFTIPTPINAALYAYLTKKMAQLTKLEHD